MPFAAPRLPSMPIESRICIDSRGYSNTSSIKFIVSASISAPFLKSNTFLKRRAISIPNLRCASSRLALLASSSLILWQMETISLSKSFAKRSMAVLTNLSKWKCTLPIALRKMASSVLPSSVSKKSTMRGIRSADVGKPIVASTPAPSTTRLSGLSLLPNILRANSSP